MDLKVNNNRTFKGYKNVLQGGMHISEKIGSPVTHKMVAEITDVGTPDLTKIWRPILDKYPGEGNFVRLDFGFHEFMDTDEGIDIYGNNRVDFGLNGHKLAVNKENCGVFTQINALLKQISKTADNAKFENSKTFEYDDNFKKGVKLLEDEGENLDVLENDVKEFMQSPKNIKQIADFCNKTINKKLLEFLSPEASKYKRIYHINPFVRTPESNYER